MDITNFMDPMGGEGRSTMNNGLLSIAGWGMDRGLVNTFISKPLLRAEGRSVKSRRAKSVMSSMNSFVGPRIPHEAAIGGPQSKHFAKQYNASEFHRLKDMSSRFKTYGKNIRRIGWAFIGAGLFGLAESALTPGISKTAARKEQAFFMDESPLDSGAAYTQRQRAMQAIFDSQTKLPSIIGNEASYLHQ